MPVANRRGTPPTAGMVIHATMAVDIARVRVDAKSKPGKQNASRGSLRDVAWKLPLFEVASKRPLKLRARFEQTSPLVRLLHNGTQLHLTETRRTNDGAQRVRVFVIGEEELEGWLTAKMPDGRRTLREAARPLLQPPSEVELLSSTEPSSEFIPSSDFEGDAAEQALTEQATSTVVEADQTEQTAAVDGHQSTHLNVPFLWPAGENGSSKSTMMPTMMSTNNVISGENAAEAATSHAAEGLVDQAAFCRKLFKSLCSCLGDDARQPHYRTPTSARSLVETVPSESAAPPPHVAPDDLNSALVEQVEVADEEKPDEAEAGAGSEVPAVEPPVEAKPEAPPTDMPTENEAEAAAGSEVPLPAEAPVETEPEALPTNMPTEIEAEAAAVADMAIESEAEPVAVEALPAEEADAEAPAPAPQRPEEVPTATPVHDVRFLIADAESQPVEAPEQGIR